MTVKAAQVIGEADVVAYAAFGHSIAAACHLRRSARGAPGHAVTTGHSSGGYAELRSNFYATRRIATHLDAGHPAWL